jgi:DNA-directed RNA polymerase subunit RPC12/RpoP
MQVICSECGAAFAVRDELQGRTLKCRHCQSAITVPQAQSDIFGDFDASAWDAEPLAPPRQLRRNKRPRTALPDLQSLIPKIMAGLCIAGAVGLLLAGYLGVIIPALCTVLVWVATRSSWEERHRPYQLTFSLAAGVGVMIVFAVIATRNLDGLLDLGVLLLALAWLLAKPGILPVVFLTVIFIAHSVFMMTLWNGLIPQERNTVVVLMAINDTIIVTAWCGWWLSRRNRN